MPDAEPPTRPTVLKFMLSLRQPWRISADDIHLPFGGREPDYIVAGRDGSIQKVWRE